MSGKPVPFSHQGCGAVRGVRCLVCFDSHRKMSLLLARALVPKSTLLQRMNDGGENGSFSLLSPKRNILENELSKL